MKKKYLFIAIGILTSILAFFLIFIKEESEKIELRNNNTEVVSAPEQRIWKENYIRDEYLLNSDSKDSLFRVVGLYKSGEYLLVMDEDMRLKRFDLDGKFKDSFGKGRGRGPGEFALPIGNTTLGNNKLFIADSRKRELMEFDAKTTDYITSYSIKFRPYRLITVQDKIVIESSMEERLFKVLDSEGNLIREFGKIIDDQVVNGLSVDGNIAAIPGTDRFIYAASKASFIFYFDINGKRIKTIKTPDRISFMKSIQRSAENTKTYRAPKPVVAATDVYIFGEKIYISMLKQKESNLPVSFLDIYDLGTGEYQFSAEMPVPSVNIVVTEDLVYVKDVKNNKLRAYNYGN